MEQYILKLITKQQGILRDFKNIDRETILKIKKRAHTYDMSENEIIETIRDFI